MSNWVRLAPAQVRARSELVFLDDTRPGAEGDSGHVVIRQGLGVLDPSTNQSYADLDTYSVQLIATT